MGIVYQGDDRKLRRSAPSEYPIRRRLRSASCQAGRLLMYQMTVVVLAEHDILR
jgi:hypothetical protein